MVYERAADREHKSFRNTPLWLSFHHSGERRHGVARTVFHGQRGEVRQRYREGREDQLEMLGLAVNVLVL
jgi:hypothetical protein